MANQKTTSPHPAFQPREGKRGIAANYLLWMISSKVFIKPSGCWFWGGTRSEDGYGVIEVRGKIYRVTRLLYDYCVEPLPDELLVCHECDNPPCCNLEHLYAGTHADNALDCLQRGRNPAAILTEDLVRQMRRLEATTYQRKYAMLGDRFGVSADAAREACRGEKWRHVE